MTHTNATRRRALQLYKKGVKITDIAEIVGADKTTIAAWKDAAGLTRKTRHPLYHSEKTVRTAMAAYVKGESCDAIAARLGLSRSTVVSWATRHKVSRKVKPDTHRISAKTRARAVKLYASGKPAPWISDALGVSADTIYRWCRSAGVPIRPRAPKPTIDDARVLAMHKKWKSVRITAEILGLSRTGIQRSLRRSRAAASIEQKAAV